MLSGSGWEKPNKLNTVRLTSDHYDTIRKHVLSGKSENAVFLTAGYFENRHGVNFTVRSVLIPKKKDYKIRTPFQLELSPQFFNKTLSRATADKTTIIQCHSHPRYDGSLEYSRSDDYGEFISAKTVASCLGHPMGSMLFGSDKVVGRVWLPKKSKPVSIDQIRLVDRYLTMYGIGKKQRIGVDKKVYDRQIRAFGDRGQKTLASLHIGIVGLGGTGSSVAEQLAREGIRHFILVDHDRFSPSNVTRMYGSYSTTKLEYKVNIVKKNIKKIQKGAAIRTFSRDVVSQYTLDALKDCDVVFSCTDRHRPRSVLNELAYQYFIPVIDMGVGINMDDNKISEANVRISLSSPSVPCLYCTDVIKSKHILAESLDSGDLKRRIAQGYVTGIQNNVPAVIPLTTIAASYAIIMLKDLLFRIMKTGSSTFILDATSLRTVKLARTTVNKCTCTVRVGLADSYPLSAPGRNTS